MAIRAGAGSKVKCAVSKELQTENACIQRGLLKTVSILELISNSARWFRAPSTGHSSLATRNVIRSVGVFFPEVQKYAFKKCG